MFYPTKEKGQHIHAYCQHIPSFPIPTQFLFFMGQESWYSTVGGTEDGNSACKQHFGLLLPHSTPGRQCCHRRQGWTNCPLLQTSQEQKLGTSSNTEGNLNASTCSPWLVSLKHARTHLLQRLPQLAFREADCPVLLVQTTLGHQEGQEALAL